MKTMLRALNALCHPVHLLVDLCHKIGTPTCPKEEASRRHRLRYLTGLALMLFGSSLAVHASNITSDHVAHIVLDVVAYGIHGVGAAPYGTWLVRALALE